jgi:hypothetical protein
MRSLRLNFLNQIFRYCCQGIELDCLLIYPRLEAVDLGTDLFFCCCGCMGVTVAIRQMLPPPARLNVRSASSHCVALSTVLVSTSACRLEL